MLIALLNIAQLERMNERYLFFLRPRRFGKTLFISMLQSYYGIIALLVMASGISALFLYLSATLGPKKPNAAKDMPYECGMAPFESPSGRHAVRFCVQ